MKFDIKATQPREDHPGQVWLEGHEDADTIEGALDIIRRWADGEIEPYGHGPVTFTIEVTP